MSAQFNTFLIPQTYGGTIYFAGDYAWLLMDTGQSCLLQYDPKLTGIANLTIAHTTATALSNTLSNGATFTVHGMRLHSPEDPANYILFWDKAL